MRDCKWLVDGNSMASLHSGPFIVSKYHIPDCDVQSLKCLAYLCAKAMSWTTKLKSSTIKPTKNNVLKQLHLVPGRCMLVDHYFSPKMGRLPHTFGREHIGYSCGTLFVDHDASGKCSIFVNTRIMRLKPSKANVALNLLLNKKVSKSTNFMLTMVSLLP